MYRDRNNLFGINKHDEIEQYLPQHTFKRTTSWSLPAPPESSERPYEADNGNDLHVWLSGMQKLAWFIREHGSTEHFFQPPWTPAMTPEEAKNSRDQVPHPTWAIMIIPRPDGFNPSSSLSSLGLFFQFGQPMIPNATSPSTTRARPTWRFGVGSRWSVRFWDALDNKARRSIAITAHLHLKIMKKKLPGEQLFLYRWWVGRCPRF